MELAYEQCMLCPRNCKVNRNAGETGFCGETANLRLAWAGLHFGEEPPITGTGGSGAIFVTGCNLGCSFCQNYQISRDAMGTIVSDTEFLTICTALQEAGAENINIVTGSHAIPAIARMMRTARNKGFSLPFLWNSSSYETVDALRLLDGLVDCWLPDLKTLNPEIANRFFRAPDYPETAKNALLFMAEHTKNSLMEPAMIVRHLVLPENLEDTKTVLNWFSKHLKDRALLSLMTQYTPVEKGQTHSTLDQPKNRFVSQKEHTTLTRLLEFYDIDDGFLQELLESSDWLPDFTHTQPFPSSLAQPIWYWKSGFIR
ncbi:MAG TPA: radical SAM protein [Treponema sp.]|nr:radical SAM protein [Treponema sp.]